MPRYQYKIVPAPEKASKIKGLKGPARFAATLEQAMNDLGAEGWRYLRADTLPHEERTGLTATRTTYRNLLVFYRELPDEAPDPVADDDTAIPVEPVPAPPPDPAPEPDPVPEPAPEPTDAEITTPPDDMPPVTR